jgi:molybdenum cofactor cytidylyltransferase
MPSRREGPVAGILLAAGTSSRMGKNKLLFDLEGESVIRRAVRRALAGGLSPLIVVLGHESDKAWKEIEDLPCEWALNPLYEQGINSSL